MLHEFIGAHHSVIIARTRRFLVDRACPPASHEALEGGVLLFLAQVVETLVMTRTTSTCPPASIRETASVHGGNLLALGLSVSQVVHAYGDICHVVTALAIEERVPISAGEFQLLNRCLDEAIAGAVTEHARRTAECQSTEEVERLGRLMHEARNLLNNAALAYQMMKRGDVAVNGSTGAVLGRSLASLKRLVDSTLSDVRTAARPPQPQRIPVSAFLHDIAEAGHLDAAHRGLRFSCELPPAELFIHADPQLLESAVTNLLNNAFQCTHAGGTVAMRAGGAASHLKIEVEDQCGGMPTTADDLFQPFSASHGADHTGLGLGLSIARKAVRTGGGDIRVRNLPGRGCIFVIELPLAAHPTA